MANVSLASEIRAFMHTHTHLLTHNVITESERTGGERSAVAALCCGREGASPLAALLAAERASLVSIYYVVVGALFGRRDGGRTESRVRMYTQCSERAML